MAGRDCRGPRRRSRSGRGRGGIVGALIEAGISEHHANVYAEGVRQGGTLLTVRIDDDYADEIKSVLDAHGPVNPEIRAEEYRNRGWEGFDEPPTAERPPAGPPPTDARRRPDPPPA